jgi:hypothetical protein
MLRVLLLMLLLAARPAWPGGAPETTLLVVNADSAISLAVANEYIRLRDLPERQVLWLRNIPVGDTLDIEAFRHHILDPIRNHFIKTGLGNEIDLIVYSAGFPYGVDFSRDLERAGREQHKRIGTVGSLTGMSYFLHRVAAMDLGYLHPRANQYFRPPRLDARGAGIGFEPARSFRSHHAWRQGHPRATGSSFDRYFLSVMLGYDGLRGNSLPEMLHYLERAAGADGTRPDGTLYLMENRNIRSRVRQPLFPIVMEAMREQGRAVEIIAQGQRDQDGRIPRNRTDIVGVVAGTRLFDWENSGSRMLPGAIAESFTSYGGHFSHGRQTKLSEFLRHGAAGSSGAVREPYSFIEKFPVPHLHYYYAQGSSLAEAFYQSVASPYQLIVVGDPLTRPFARFAELELKAPEMDKAWRGVVHLQPVIRMPPGETLNRIELWINGLPVAQAKEDEALSLDTRTLADGFHDLRLVAVAGGPIETRSYRGWPIRVDNQGRQSTLRLERERIPHGDVVRVSGRAEDALAVRLRQGVRVLAEVETRQGHWQASVPAALLGQGVVRLLAEARYPDGGLARSAVHVLQVLPPTTSGTVSLPGTTGQGVQVRVRQPDGMEHALVLEGLDGGHGPREWRDLRSGSIQYRGLFETRATGLYELVLEAVGQVHLSIDGAVIMDRHLPSEEGGARIALPLDQGWHAFEIAIHGDRDDPFPRLSLTGPEPAFWVEGERVRHVPSEP